MARYKLLTDDRGQAKLAKGRAAGWYNVGLSLAPYKTSGIANLCPHATAGCAALCLTYAGRGAMNNVQGARIRKTAFFFENRELFMRQLKRDLTAHQRFCQRERLRPCCRLNVFSDLAWEILHPEIFAEFPETQFYDYTKSYRRMERFLLGADCPHASGQFPANYHLTFSRSEKNEENCRQVIAMGGQVAVVFSSADFPAEYLGAEVVDGDEHDMRFLQPDHCVIGLKAKGLARTQLDFGLASGFVVDAREPVLV